MGNDVKWTKDQQEVIAVRNKNVLVSAAAGSGKTAVLVERIISMISDKEKPVDIDHLLVVTFTNAAAAEMGERIEKALEKKAEADPDDMHIRRQITLIRNAKICTFHSFCQSVLRNHFHEIGLDPSFRIGDVTELKLLKNDCLQAIFEEKYACYQEKKLAEEAGGPVLTDQDKAFVQLVESYASNRSDVGLRDMILQLHDFAMSYPWPKQWLEDKKENFHLQNLDDMEQTAWMQFLLNYMETSVKDLLRIHQQARDILYRPDDPVPMYKKVFEEDLLLLQNLEKCHTYQAFADCLQSVSWGRLSTAKGGDKDLREQLKVMRENWKSVVKEWTEKFFFQSPQEMLADMQALALPMTTLLDLTKEFMSVFAKEKEQRHLVDFNDLEHFTVSILVNPKTQEPSAVAKSYQNFFEEILVDEYQDSNEVQETILQSIARREPAYPNVFMVGDVKQSIYKFRMARPELFMEKFDTYALEKDQPNRRIDLGKNFRSRSIVLDSVNAIFELIMQRSLGKVAYDENARLYLGNESFAESAYTSKKTELLLFDKEADEREESLVSDVEWEARMVGMRIKELIFGEHPLEVMDKATGLLRPCRFGDMAILLRSVEGRSDIYLEVLQNMGIPAFTETRTGYFSTFEIRTMLQLLKVLDNPRQDIPLAAVMRSMFGNFSGEEMAILRQRYPNCDLLEAVEAYGGLQSYAQVEEKADIDLGLSKKADAFMQLLDRLREKVPITPIHQLLEEIYEETGFYDYVSVLPNGAQRRDNLDMLVQKALDMEASNMSTLFHYNRYIEKLHKYEVDFGEAVSTETSMDAVNIMSIHKSKGLEFPIVFVGAMSKNFNNRDVQSKLLLNLDLGVAADLMNPDKRIKMPTLLKRIMAKQNTLENLGEELRVLYVALTRAKEKLIMAGVLNAHKELEKAKLSKVVCEEIQAGICQEKIQEEMDYLTRVSAKSYLDWVAPVVVDGEKKDYFSLRLVSAKELVVEEVKEQMKAQLKKNQLLQWNTKTSYEEDLSACLEKMEAYTYPFAHEREIKSKLSVSELKHLAMEKLLTEEMGEPIFEKEEKEVPMPAFLQEEQEMTGANYGTIYHKVFEKMHFMEGKEEAGVEKELLRMVASGFLTEEEKNVIHKKDFVAFANASLGLRMEKAQENRRLWREQPFVIGIPAKQVKAEWDSDSLVLVQGIIDAYFEEDGEIVLVDYKTDQVKNGQELVDRYAEQLRYYQKALEQLTGKRVKEKILYAVRLGEEVLVP